MNLGWNRLKIRWWGGICASYKSNAISLAPAAFAPILLGSQRIMLLEQEANRARLAIFITNLFALLRRHALAVAGLAILLPIAGLATGFVWFVSTLERDETLRVPPAEGIVALTGGADRIADALDLIATGHAGRMLISGVNQSISGEELANLTPGQREWYHCCIDLGYEATNTIGNAVETRRWAREHGIRHSLIVVTSNYHMPRALLELGRALPQVQLVPFPVVSEKVRDGLWSDPQVVRMLGIEYLKYVAALAHARTMPEPEGQQNASFAPFPLPHPAREANAGQ